MRFGGPVAQANNFKRNGAIQAFLAGPIYHSLPTASDFLQQFVIAKIGERLCPIRFLFNTGQWPGSIRARSIESGYRIMSQQIKSGLKQTSCTKAFRCVGKNFRAALSTNPGCAAHDGRVVCTLPIMYCAEFWHTLRSQHSDQM